jgi:hypothetical protein
MNNYLALKKQPVKYWSKVGGLILASLPLLYNLVKQKHADLDNSIVKAVDGIV